MVLTAATIAAAMGGRLVAGSADRGVDGFAIDSRTLAPGDLFFAIVANRDGHEFVGAALARGASGAVVSRDPGKLPGTAPFHPGGASPDRPILIHVADTTAALQALARAVRRASAATVVAVTGSTGKTTTKDAIAELIAARFRVAKNPGNLNNHLGLPLSLLELRRGADVAVMELGMSHPGEIRLLVGVAEPEVRVWTNVGDAHIGYFASREAIADAKAEILEQASAASVLVCNADDPLVMARVPAFPGRTIAFGESARADVRAEAVDDRGLFGTRFRLRRGDEAADVDLQLVGRGNLANALAASAVALELGVPLAEVADGCRLLRPASHRGVVLRLAGGIVVLDDSYNSSPAALARVLDVVARDTEAARKAAVLGEMRELGVHARRLHEASGRAAAQAGLDRLIVVGGNDARALAVAAIDAGMDQAAVTWTPSAAAAADLVVPWLRAGDLLVVKGSRAINTDLVVDRIVAERS